MRSFKTFAATKGVRRHRACELQARAGREAEHLGFLRVLVLRTLEDVLPGLHESDLLLFLFVHDRPGSAFPLVPRLHALWVISEVAEVGHALHALGPLRCRLVCMGGAKQHTRLSPFLALVVARQLLLHLITLRAQTV